ncbi:MAG: CARDB domain-containing protein [Euryarchaeota archaeon]|nr:CARDB domain-containing protein [Euryarchaeota archaeon]
MRNFGTKLLMALIIMVCVLQVATVASAAPPSMSADSADVSIGDTFEIDITVDPQGNSVSGAQYDLTFDPAILQVVKQTKGNFLSQDGASTIEATNKFNNTIGKIEYDEGRIADDGVTVAGVLATITFEAVSAGSTDLELSNMMVSDPDAILISVVVLNDGKVNVTGESQEEPDLTITAKSETLDDSTLEVTYTVKNTGGESAGASTTGIYAGSTQIATDSVEALAAGANYTSTVIIDPFDCPYGTTVTVKVCADDGNAVDEGDEANNCRENEFNCPPGQEDPKLCADPEHDFGAVQKGQTRTWQFGVTNCGGGPLDWTVTGDQSWITVSPASGTDAGTVAVTIDTAGLSDGTHTGTVTVASDYGTETGTITVDVQSTQEDPKLCADPEHNFGTVQPDQTATWQFGVTNCGGAGTLTWTVADDQSWITVSPTSGTDAGTVTVTIDTAGLSPGTHTGIVTVASDYGTETGKITVNVKGSQPSPTPSDVPTFTPIGMFALVGLLGVAGIGVIRRR